MAPLRSRNQAVNSIAANAMSFCDLAYLPVSGNAWSGCEPASVEMSGEAIVRFIRGLSPLSR